MDLFETKEQLIQSYMMMKKNIKRFTQRKMNATSLKFIYINHKISYY